MTDAVFSYLKKRVYHLLDIDQGPKSVGRPILTQCLLFVDGKQRKVLRLLPLDQTPCDYVVHLHECVEIHIEYCYQLEPQHIYRYIYSPNETIVFPVTKMDHEIEDHPVTVFTWIPQQVPVNITTKWHQWEGPCHDFYGKYVPISVLMVDEELDEPTDVVLVWMLSDGTKYMASTTSDSVVGWPLPESLKEKVRPCSIQEFEFVTKMSQMTKDQTMEFFSAIRKTEDSVSETESEDETESEQETETEVVKEDG